MPYIYEKAYKSQNGILEWETASEAEIKKYLDLYYGRWQEALPFFHAQGEMSLPFSVIRARPDEEDQESVS